MTKRQIRFALALVDDVHRVRRGRPGELVEIANSVRSVLTALRLLRVPFALCWFPCDDRYVEVGQFRRAS